MASSLVSAIISFFIVQTVLSKGINRIGELSNENNEVEVVKIRPMVMEGKLSDADEIIELLSPNAEEQIIGEYDFNNFDINEEAKLPKARRNIRILTYQRSPSNQYFYSGKSFTDKVEDKTNEITEKHSPNQEKRGNQEVPTIISPEPLESTINALKALKKVMNFLNSPEGNVANYLIDLILNHYNEPVVGPISTSQVDSSITVNNKVSMDTKQKEFERKEFVFLMSNAFRKNSRDTSDDDILVIPLAKINSAVLNTNQIDKMMDLFRKELGKPKYFLLLRQILIESQKKYTYLKAANNIFILPKKSIKPTKCSGYVQPPYGSLYGAPKWIMCTGELEFEKSFDV